MLHTTRRLNTKYLCRGSRIIQILRVSSLALFFFWDIFIILTIICFDVGIQNYIISFLCSWASIILDDD